MKKLIAAGAFALFGVIALSSCKKDYTCVCKVNNVEASSTTINDTKSNAKEECEKNNGTTTVFGQTTTVDCSIQ